MAIPQFSNVRVLRDEIVVEEELNSRQPFEPETVKKLADSIKAQGLLAPPLLIRASQMGEEFTDKGLYVLVAGFRRQAALDLLEVKEADYRLAPADWVATDALTANLTENLAREDLTPYETAMQCAKLRDEFGMTAADIAKKVKAHDSDPEGKQVLSESHVNNLVRCATELHPQILEAWKVQHPRASLRMLIKLSAEKDQTVQVGIWDGMQKGMTYEEACAAVGKDADKGKKKENKEKDPPRPSAAVLALAIKFVKKAVKDGKRDPEWGKGAVAALKYASGVEKGIPGVKMTEEDPEGEEDDADGKN